jgi:hypothetical protein
VSLDREQEGIVESWLRADEHVSADRILDDVLDQVDRTPQRRPPLPVRRYRAMSNIARIAIAAAAVVAIAVVGVNLLEGNGVGPGGAPPSPVGETGTAAPTTAPSVEATGPLPSIPELGGGTYSPGPASTYVVDRSALPDLLANRITFGVPPDWRDLAGKGVTRNDVSLTFQMLESIYLDPCNWSTGGFADPPFMRGLDLLAEGLYYEWGAWADEFHPTLPRGPEPTVVRVDGRGARYVEFQVPDDLDMSACDDGEYRLWIDKEGGIRSARGAGELNRIWIIPLGTGNSLVVIDASSMPASSADDLAELDAILGSIQVERR